jgi:Ser/Thr protein kinase RdoA (MazF antagonist)
MDQTNLLRRLQDLALASLAEWRLECVAIQIVKYRENAVYKVLAANGERYAMRMHRSGYHTDAELRSELQWMAALRAAGIEVPTVIPTVAGELFVRAVLPDTNETVQIDLFEWIDGAPIGTTEGGLGDRSADIERMYRTIGRIAARLHDHASGWDCPQGFTRHAWDVDGLVGEQPFWGRFWELEALSPAQRRLLLDAREIVRTELVAMAASPEHAAGYGLIHADFVPDNLMVSGGSVRLIDFDDAGYGWHLFEIATALYFIRDDPNYAIARDALIAGYREHRHLSDRVLEKLPVLMMARGFTYLGWVHTRRAFDVARELTPFVVRLACDLAAPFVASYSRAQAIRTSAGYRAPRRAVSHPG